MREVPANLTRRERWALRFLGYGLVRIGAKAPQASATPQAARIRHTRAAAVLALLAFTGSCATPVHLAGSCRAHEVGVVRFAGDCPVALCQPVDGGFAWVRVEDACAPTAH